MDKQSTKFKLDLSKLAVLADKVRPLVALSSIVVYIDRLKKIYCRLRLLV